MNIPIEIIQPLLVLALVAAGALTWAAFVAGLYLGERGRRLDAYRREGRIRVDEPEPAESIPQGAPTGPGELEEAPAAFLQQAMEEGYTEEEAQEEWRRLSSKAMGETGGGGWVQEGL